MWCQYPPDLTDSGDRPLVGEVVEDQRADHEVERAVRERQVLGVALNQLHRLGAVLRW